MTGEGKRQKQSILFALFLAAGKRANNFLDDQMG